MPRPLTVVVILAWADAHIWRTGRWPTLASGRIPGSGGETWNRVDWSLRRGGRGLPKLGSLSQLLKAERPRNKPERIPLKKRGRKVLHPRIPKNIVKQYRAGLIHMGDIAAALGVCYAIARRELVQAGVTVRGVGRLRKRPA